MRGDVWNTIAYAHSKMLNHASWARGNKRLPRKITPSDVDFWSDAGGAIIFAELDRNISEWQQMRYGNGVFTGQARSYLAAVRHGPHCACLCRHEVDPVSGRKIDTRTDIISFQLLVWELSSFRVTPLIIGNDKWQRFFLWWHENPTTARARIVEVSSILCNGIV